MIRTIAFVVTIASLAIETVFAATPDSCQRWYEWSTDGVFDGHTFSGSVLRGTDDHMAYFDTPFFLSPNVTESKVAGRVMGGFWPSGEGDSFLASGFWNFNFFDEETGEATNTWISANLGFGAGNTTVKSPNVVTGGTGRYLGFVGSIETKVINSDPFVIQFDLCPSEEDIVIENECKEVFEWSSSGMRTINDYRFSGSVPFPSNTSYGGVANTPFFPNTNLTPSEVEGRLVAQYFLDRITTASGSFNFGTFPKGNDTDVDDWISVNFGFGPLDTSLDGSFTRGTPNIVVGGTGKYSGFVGSMRDKAVSTDPLVFLYEICPAEETEPSPDVMESCFSVYEWSTPRRSNFSGYQFAGTALYEEGDEHTGVFDTPFFASPDVENSEVMGRVMGYYIPNGRGAASGLWNFAFFEKGSEDTENWIAASLGFDNDDTATSPNVITGGSGAFSGFTGTIEQQIVSFDPFVIEWTICPPLPDDSDDDGSSDSSSSSSSDDGASDSSSSSFSLTASWAFGFAVVMQLFSFLC